MELLLLTILEKCLTIIPIFYFNGTVVRSDVGAWGYSKETALRSKLYVNFCCKICHVVFEILYITLEI